MTEKSKILESNLLGSNRNLLKRIVINGVSWTTENFSCFIQGSQVYDNSEYFGRVFGRVYYFETLISHLPNELILPSAEDWHKLIKSFNNNVFEMSFKGYSGISLHPTGFHLTPQQVITNTSVLYWTSTREGKKQIAVFFDFLNNKFDFITIPRNLAVAARLIIN